MAAPSGAFASFKLPTLLSGVAIYDNYPALKLGEYGNNIKALFYLDHLLIVQNGGNVGFMGMVATNGFNARMHNLASRQSKLHSRGPNGQEYLLLNDAGLNTFAYAGNIRVNNTSADRTAVYADFKSAYYSGTSDFGIYYRFYVTVDGGQWSSWFRLHCVTGNNTIATQGTATDQYFRFGVDEFTDVQVYAFTVNEEGEFDTDILQFRSTARQGPPSFSYRSYSAYNEQEAYNALVNHQWQGGTLYQNDYAGSPDTNIWYQYFNYNNGQPVFSNVAPDGYYLMGDESGVSAEIRIVNGYSA